MVSTYDIRLTAIRDNYKVDKDSSRYTRELSRLQIDVSARLRRCKQAGSNCNELECLVMTIEDLL